MKAIKMLVLAASAALFLGSCEGDATEETYFTFEHNGMTWEADPAEFLCTHNDVSDYFDIIAVGEDGSSVLMRFAPVSNGEGSYDLSGDAEGSGNDTHVLFQQDPDAGEMDLSTYESSFTEEQQDVLEITMIDRSNPDFNIVEGTFAFTVYPLYPASNPVGPEAVTNGKFRVKFEPGGASGPSL